MSYEQITYEQRGAVALVTMNRPERLNAWTEQMHNEMRDAIKRAVGDDSVGAVVLTGAGRAFCAGADIAAFKEAIEASSTTGSGAAEGPGNWVSFCQGVGKPLIAAINGPAVGVGITQVLPFDIRIASENARIGMFFVRMGLVPELASSHLLSQLVGTGRATEWCLTGRMVGAEEAREAGLVTEVVPAEGLVERAIALGNEVAALPGETLARVKRLLIENAVEGNLEAVLGRENVALAQARASAEHREAVTAFMEKRPPAFARRGQGY
ncbi:MAG: enoyl-CoA hydratase/isomerase family protein [Dehalococcoidia bacterium]|nr:enoyl-CoA hydratase [Chloroflexi bacterium CFX7]MCK6564207.1 enoyl-CoA hydratase-related protein [Dehalococcoidia bacterium]MCL4230651.1 enoyl-CoA hydratase/isomerase family protein [Dehalococcoidia bacterium]NUQ55955.1 enoyl-CoA hydratase/isomerase family protein [Dehalococcoidia bacterium]RIL02490.1 MAG: enoyl-CoA hydratase [bacterium]